MGLLAEDEHLDAVFGGIAVGIVLLGGFFVGVIWPASLRFPKDERRQLRRELSRDTFEEEGPPHPNPLVRQASWIVLAALVVMLVVVGLWVGWPASRPHSRANKRSSLRSAEPAAVHHE